MRLAGRMHRWAGGSRLAERPPATLESCTSVPVVAMAATADVTPRSAAALAATVTPLTSTPRSTRRAATASASASGVTTARRT